MIVDQLVPKLLEAAKRKNMGGIELRPLHIKSHLWVFVNSLIENPTFDSQTKENMTLQLKPAELLGNNFIKRVTEISLDIIIVTHAGAVVWYNRESDVMDQSQVTVTATTCQQVQQSERDTQAG